MILTCRIWLHMLAGILLNIFLRFLFWTAGGPGGFNGIDFIIQVAEVASRFVLQFAVGIVAHWTAQHADTALICDTGASPYIEDVAVDSTDDPHHDPLPSIYLTDEVCVILDAWIRNQAGNGDPGEGSPEWGRLIRQIAQLHPEAEMAEESEE